MLHVDLHGLEHILPPQAVGQHFSFPEQSSSSVHAKTHGPTVPGSIAGQFPGLPFTTVTKTYILYRLTT